MLRIDDLSGGGFIDNPLDNAQIYEALETEHPVVHGQKLHTCGGSLIDNRTPHRADQLSPRRQA